MRSHHPGGAALSVIEPAGLFPEARYGRLVRPFGPDLTRSVT
jgi:hypothetical protein